MKTRLLCALLSLIVVSFISQVRGAPLMFAARNIAKGNGNFYLYCKISNEKLKIEKGDVLEYDVYLSPDNPLPVGGVDFATDGGAVSYTHLRAHETPEHLVCRLLLEKKK